MFALVVFSGVVCIHVFAVDVALSVAAHGVHLAVGCAKMLRSALYNDVLQSDIM